MIKIKAWIALVAAFVCGGAWAAVGDTITICNANKGSSRSAATFTGNTFSICIPASTTLPEGSTVAVTTITVGMNSRNDTANFAPYMKIGDTISNPCNGTGEINGDASVVFANNALKQAYGFTDKGLVLTVGTSYDLAFCSDAEGTVKDGTRWYCEQTQDPAFSVIKQSKDALTYRPTSEFVGVVQTVAGAVPSFAFTGDANGGSASGFTISGEGGDAAKKTIGPAGTQVPMIYFVSNSDKWHPWANFTAKDTFTLAAYVNTSTCKPAEGKNGIIWSMGNNGGNRVMLVKSSDGKIKLITASGANITNESTAPAFDETAGYHLYTASFSTTEGLKLTVDADTANAKTDSSAKTKAADGFQIGSIFQGLQTAKFEVGNNIGIANLIGYDSVISDSQIAALSADYPAVAMTITTDIHQDTANKEVVLMSATTDGNHFIGVSKGTMTIPAGVEVSVPHIRCINNNATGDRATFNVAGTVNVTSESTNPNVWADRASYKGVLFGHYHGQGTYNITGTLNAPNTYVELCYTAEAQTLNVNGGTLTTKGIHTNNGQGAVNLSNDGRIVLSTSTFMNVPVTVTGGTIAAGETANYAKQLTVSSGELALEVGAEETLTLNGGVSNSGTISVKTGTVVIPAGSEGTVTVAAGATLKLRVTDAQIATGYTATNVTLPADTDIVFVNAQGETVEGGSGNALAPAAVVWTGDVDNNWNTDGNWSSGSAPTSETVVTIKKDATITMASDSTYKQLFIESNVTFAGTIDLSTMHDITMSDAATISVDVASGNGKMKGVTGGKVIKTGAGYLYISNATNNGTALTGATIQIDGGTVHLDGGYNGDVNMTNPTFIIGANGALTTYGWTSVSGTLTLESDSDKSIFMNNGGKGGKIKGGPAIVKNGTGTITLLAGSDANFGAITLNGGRLDFGSNQATTVGGVISGAGALGVNGSGVVTINGNNSFSGGTIIASGELAMGHTNALGGQGKAVAVNAGGTLNVNGQQNHGLNLTLAGGTLKSEGTAAGTGNVQFRSITLTADSTINASVMAGITNNGHNPTTLDLGGFTLTKTGEGNLLLCNVTIKNPGLIDMQGGSFDRDGRTLTFDMSGVEIGSEATLVQYPDGASASADGMTISGVTGYILRAKDNLIVVSKIVAKVGDTPYLSIQDAVDALTGEQTLADVIIVDPSATVPPAYAKVTTGDVVTLRSVGGKVYYKSGDWTEGCTVWTDADHTATTTFTVADTMVFDTTGVVVYPSKNITSALKIEIAADITVVIGHDNYLSENPYNVPDNSVITLGENAHLGITFWNNATDYTPALGTVTINGGTFGVYNVTSKAINIGTLKGTSTLVLNEGDTVTVSGSIETDPISGVAHKHVETTEVSGGTRYSLAVDMKSLAIPDVAHTTRTVTVDGVATDIVDDAIAAPFGSIVVVTYVVETGYRFANGGDGVVRIENLADDSTVTAPTVEEIPAPAPAEAGVSGDPATMQPVLTITDVTANTEVTVTVTAGDTEKTYTAPSDAQGTVSVPLSGADKTLAAGQGYTYVATAGGQTVAEGGLVTGDTYFRADPAGTNVNGTWTTAPTVKDGAFQIDTESAVSFTVTDTTPATGKSVLVDQVITFDGPADFATLSADLLPGAIGAVTIGEETVNDAPQNVWKAWNGYAWETLTGTMPELPATVAVKMTLDPGQKFTITVQAQDGSVTYVTKTLTTTKTTVSGVCYVGTGALAKLEGVTAPVVAYIGVDGDQKLAVDVSAEFAATIAGKSSPSRAEVQAALNADANATCGLKNWQAYVLGITTAEGLAAANLVVDFHETSVADRTLTFADGYLANQQRVGVRVKRTVLVGATQETLAPVTTTSETDASVTITLPENAPRVNFFQIRYDFE